MSGEVTIVIIGAPLAGSPIAHQLLKSLPSIKFILTTPSKVLHWSLAAPRLFAKANAFNLYQYLIPVAEQY